MPEITRAELAAAEIRSEDLRWADIEVGDTVSLLYKPTGELFSSVAHTYERDGLPTVAVLEYDVGADADEFDQVTLIEIEKSVRTLQNASVADVGRATVTDGSGNVFEDVVVVRAPSVTGWGWHWYVPEAGSRWFRDENLSNFRPMNLVEDK
jgi:hypothetical protein